MGFQLGSCLCRLDLGLSTCLHVTAVPVGRGFALFPKKEIAVSKEKMLPYQQTNEAVSSRSSGVRSVRARLKLPALWPVTVSRVVK